MAVVYKYENIDIASYSKTKGVRILLKTQTTVQALFLVFAAQERPSCAARKKAKRAPISSILDLSVSAPTTRKGDTPR